MNSIRGSDVFVKEDIKAMLLGLQCVAAQYPPGEFAAGFLACLSAMRATLAIPATLEEIDAVIPPPAAMLASSAPAVVDAVRVLPPAPAQQLGTVGGRQFRIEGHREAAVAAVALPDLAADDPPPAGWRRLNVAPVVPVNVADADRVVEVEHGDDPVVVRPDRWRLVTWGAEGFVYDEIAGPGRYVLPADRWVPVPVAWRGRMGVELVPDQWALFVTVDWAIRTLGRARVERLPDGRAQITG